MKGYKQYNQIVRIVLLIIIMSIVASAADAQSFIGRFVRLSDSPMPLIELEVQPFTEDSVYAVEENIPAGVTPSDINENGVWDATHRKIKWGPFFDSVPRTLRYRLTGLDGTYELVGSQGSFDGSGFIVNGEPFFDETVVITGTDYPTIFYDIADNESVNPTLFVEIFGGTDTLGNDNVIEFLVTLFTPDLAASVNIAPPLDPIDIAGVFDEPENETLNYYGWLYPASSLGTNSILFSLGLGGFSNNYNFTIDVFFRNAAHSQISANDSVTIESRRIFDNNTPSPSVSIAFTPTPATLSYAVEESLPEEITPFNMSDNGIWNAETRSIRWGPFLNNFDSKELTYEVIGIVGNHTVSGLFSVNGQELKILGDKKVKISEETLSVVEGIIQDEYNVPLSEIVVELVDNDGNSLFAQTDNAGYFNLIDLEPGVYTLSPLTEGVITHFIPLVQQFEIMASVPQTHTLNSFTAFYVPSRIAGTVTDGAIVIENVGINLFDTTDNSLVTSTTTDSLGQYVFDNLSRGEYRIEPDNTALTFNPEYEIIDLNDTPYPTIDFVVQGAFSITSVTSNVFNDMDSKYRTGRMVKISLAGTFQHSDLLEGTIRIIQVSTGAEVLSDALQIDPLEVYYHFDTTDFAEDSYIVAMKLAHVSGYAIENRSLIIELTSNIRNKSIFEDALDMIVMSPGLPIQFRRTFSRKSNINSAFGTGWTHSYFMHLVETSDGWVKLFEQDGSGSYFKPNGDGTYQPPKRDKRQLTKIISVQDTAFELKELSGRKFIFDVFGNLIRIEERNGNTLNLAYSWHGAISGEWEYLLEQITSNYGQMLQLTYDNENNLIQLRDNDTGRTVEYNYVDNQLSSVTDVHGLTTGYLYNAQTFTKTDPSGGEQVYSFDADFRLISEVYAGQYNRFNYEYLEENSQLKIIDPYDNETIITFNRNGLATEALSSNNFRTLYIYDDNLDLRVVEDANSYPTFKDYDNNGNVKTIITAENDSIAFTYGLFNQVSSVNYAHNQITYFEYDNENGNLRRIVYPDNSMEELFDYYPSGLLKRKTDRNGREIEYTYTPSGKAASITYLDNSSIESFVEYRYDSRGNLIEAESDNDGQKLIFVYDGNDMLTQVSYHPTGETIVYSYDQGRRKTVTYPGNALMLEYFYDAANRLEYLTAGGIKIVEYDYDNAGRVMTRNLNNGTYTSSYTFNALGWLTNLSHRYESNSLISQFQYTYDNVGNRLSMNTNEGLTMYTYDRTYQLQTVIYPQAPDTEYLYDSAGNRLAFFENDSLDTLYTVDNESNQYIAENEGGTLTTYEYDSNGNLTAKNTPTGRIEFTYNFANRMIKVETPSDTIEFAYDPFGRRKSKISTSSAIKYIHDGLHVIQENDLSDTVLARYVYGMSIDEIILMQRNNIDYYYLTDGLGSISELVWDNETSIESYTYDVYGIPGAISTAGNPYLFTGRAYDTETGLYYYRARYYDPNLGRFLTPDPIGYKAGLNLYTYVENNPVNSVDPLGLEPENKCRIKFVPPLLPSTLTPAESTIPFTPEFTQSTGTTVSSVNGNFAAGQGDCGPPAPPGVDNGDPTFIQPSRRKLAALNAESSQTNNDEGLIAEIHVPYDDALVRANIPVFGVAYGRKFKEFKLEYGVGNAPTEWTAINVSSTPHSDRIPYADMGITGDQTVYGNLGTWDTGLQNYVYGDEFPANHPIDLTGTYTIRLTVEGTDDTQVEDRVIVDVGRVIPTIYGGTAHDPEKNCIITLPEHALTTPFLVIGVQQINPDDFPQLQKELFLSPIYEIRPPGTRFIQPVSLQINLNDTPSERAEICFFNADLEEWQIIPGAYDSVNHCFKAYLSGFPQDRVFVSVIRKKPNHEYTFSPFAEKQPLQIAGITLENTVTPSDTLLHNTFEQDVEGWHNPHSFAGGLPEKITHSWYGNALQITNVSNNSSFAAAVPVAPFDVAQFPYVQFEYKIPQDVKINLLVKIDGRWYDILFTDDPKLYTHVNMEYIGQIPEVIADDEWHTAQFNLYEMLLKHPPLHGSDQFIIQNMMFADWDTIGFMKLSFGTNRKGASYSIDNFAITAAPQTWFERLKPSLTQWFSQFSVSPAYAFAQVPLKQDILSVELHDSQSPLYVAPDGKIFHSENFRGRIDAKIRIAPDETSILNIDYDVTDEGSYAGYFHPLNKQDLRDYRALSLWIKGATGNETCRIGLKNSRGEEAKVLIDVFLPYGINRSWQKVIIPFTTFNAVNSFDSIENISFIFENGLRSSSGTVSIHSIQMEKDLSPLVIARCSNRTEKTVWGTDFWTFSAANASIDYSFDPFGCLIHFDDIVASRDRISWGGWGISLDNLDVSSYTTVSLRIKRVIGNERPNLYLEDKNQRHYIDLEEYLTDSPDWQTAQIPLQKFSAKGIDISNLLTLSLVFEWEKMAGAVYIDSIQFDNTSAEFHQRQER